MKRTKERFGKFESYNQQGQSGLKVFDGEDLEYQDRFKLQQLQQKSWVEQQKYEKEMKEQQEREEERQHAEQTLSINRMRSILEADHDQKRKEMNRQMMEINKKLAEEKKQREFTSKYHETQLDLYNINEAEEKRNNVYSKLRDEIDSCKSYIDMTNSQSPWGSKAAEFYNSKFPQTQSNEAQPEQQPQPEA